MITQVKIDVNQLSPSVAGDGDTADIRGTRLGQLLTANWKINLLLAGRVWRTQVGTFAADGDVGQITGGGGGTTLEVEKPEIAIGVDAGYFLIPMEIDLCCQSDTDFPTDYMRSLAMLDRTQAPPTSVTGSPGILTPTNMLEGGPSFPGRAFGGVTSDIDGTNSTDPILSELLYYKTKQSVEMVLNGTATNITAPVWNDLPLHYEPVVPSLAKGPCGLYVYWGGTVAVTALATVVFACVPVSWFE